MRVAPQWSHVSRCPPSTAVRQVAIARSARAAPSRVGACDDTRRHERARCPRARAEDGTRATAVPDRHGAHG